MKTVKWIDKADNNLTFDALIIEFLPAGSPCGFSKSTTSVYILELLESHPNGVRHLKGQRVFASISDIIFN